MRGQEQDDHSTNWDPGTPISFFIMPDSALKSLRDELQLLVGENDTTGVLYRLGFRCGEGLARDVGENCSGFAAVCDVLPELWMQIGLSSINIPTCSENELVVEIINSLEAYHRKSSHQGSCDFTKGYLEGIITTMMGQKMRSAEINCILRGDEKCVFNIIKDTGVIVPVPEDHATTEQKYDLETASTYLFKNESPAKCFDIFEDYVTHGMNGICVTRTYPNMIRDTHHLLRTPIIWLTKEEGENNIQPHQLGKLNHILEDFLKKSRKAVLLIDGLEYLITHNNFASVLKFIQILRDKISVSSSLLLLPISPETLDDKSLKLLERETTVYSETTPEEDMVESIFSKMHR